MNDEDGQRAMSDELTRGTKHRQGFTATTRRIRDALHRVVLMRETGPKSAAWQRARVQTIWRLHALLEASQQSPPEQPLGSDE
ncbi:MAG: hypothetical protein HC884_17940 [Chloroflexaceae bacterium]|nr:hypothetical protein [Chloroflexaceae bacterium]